MDDRIRRRIGRGHLRWKHYTLWRSPRELAKAAPRAFRMKVDFMPPALNPRHSVYVGSFDPMTLGHEDIVRRGAGIFERVTVGIGINPEKKSLFSSEERLALARTVLAPIRNVHVECFNGLAVDFVRRCGAAVMLRGLRTLTDIETEFTMSLANRNLAPEIETIFLMSGAKYTHISSSLIKQVAQMGDRECAERLRAFVPEAIIRPLIDRFAQPGALESNPRSN
jgi:pantetheine-phosphate adenylyltransferase